MGVVNGINAFVPTMLAQGDEGARRQHDVGQRRVHAADQQRGLRDHQGRGHDLTECLWGQLREIDAKVGASLLYPSTRTPGMLNTGIWRPGAQPPRRATTARARRRPRGTRRSYADVPAGAWRAGQEVAFAPLSEVADLCFEGIRDDVFWMSNSTGDEPTPGSAAASLVRAQSQVDRSLPEYLIQATERDDRPQGRRPGLNPATSTTSFPGRKPRNGLTGSEDVRLATGDLAEAVTRLKQERSDGYLLAHGGTRFARSLVETGLIDEYRLVVHPVVLGAGERLFSAPLTIEPTTTIVFRGGAVAHVFGGAPVIRA